MTPRGHGIVADAALGGSGMTPAQGEGEPGMTRDETVALFLECEAKRAGARAAALAGGKDEDDADTAAHEAAEAHWNAWAEARLAERRAMEADGRWAAEEDWKGDLEPQNDDTRAWMENAKADFSRCLFLVRGAEGTKETVGEDKEEAATPELAVKSVSLDGNLIRFDGFIFPGDASFQSATFTGTARFQSATFTGYAGFERATFTSAAHFASATFTGHASFERATFTSAASFASATFTGHASFESATFSGHAWFERATFTGGARFESATFSGGAWFASATFTGDARFESAAFSGDAWFERATFAGGARFESATFYGGARFESATFTGFAQFGSATFTGGASFESTTFTDPASFESATFSGTASFESATLSGTASFGSATFTGEARFKSATFTCDARFESATFIGDASFASATFSGDARFKSATFSGDARFQSATFQRFTAFGKATFAKEASFTGIKVDRAFDMTGARFKKVPSFNQADFKQAPDLDNVEFPLPGFWRRGEAALIAHYRAIRRMAIQGADYEREQMAFKGETRSKRGTEHKPWHPAFWFGIAYDAFSDFGRSIARPLAIWFASGLAFAAIYLWNASAGASGWLSPCAGDGASKALKAATLSAANALPLIGSSRGEVAAEFYRCLDLPHVPAWSPLLQIWQTLWSTLLIFLFLLALRNQFKIK
jgi:hypothetical protein